MYHDWKCTSIYNPFLIALNPCINYLNKFDFFTKSFAVLFENHGQKTYWILALEQSFSTRHAFEKIIVIIKMKCIAFCKMACCYCNQPRKYDKFKEFPEVVF